ncbi:hypothetical protein GCM10023334_001980 [Nonomuraea thailandensis]
MRLARAVLLAALALGVCGMHTLGHPSGGHGSAPASHVAAAAGAEGFVPDSVPPLDPTDVCLAVLISLVVLLLTGARARAGRRAESGGGAIASARRPARPPPKPASRRLATLSILRV